MIVLRIIADDDVDDTSTEADRVRASVWKRRLASKEVASSADLLRLITVFDPLGAWNTAWKCLFSALEIPHLRSPSSIGPDPFDAAGGLRAFVAREGWPAERHFVPPAALPDTGSRRVPKSSPPVDEPVLLHRSSKRLFPVDAVSREAFALPSTRAFNALCTALSEQLAGLRVDAVSVKRITPCWGDSARTVSPPTHFTLLLSDGTVQSASNVVVATGALGRPRVPSWVLEVAGAELSPETASAGGAPGGAGTDADRGDAEWRALHAFGPTLWHLSQLALEAPDGIAQIADPVDAFTPAPGALRPRFHGKRILSVGGGITSVHLVLVALAAGCADVTLLTRRPHLTARQFDVDIAWLTRARPAMLHDYRSRAPEDRASHAAASRGGGSIPAELFRRFQAALQENSSRARLWEDDEVVAAKFARSRGLPWSLQTRTGRSIDADVVALATGTRVDVTTDPLLSDLMRDCPRPGDEFIRGLPALDSTLRWAPGVNVFLGGCSCERLGSRLVKPCWRAVRSTCFARDPAPYPASFLTEVVRPLRRAPREPARSGERWKD